MPIDEEVLQESKSRLKSLTALDLDTPLSSNSYSKFSGRAKKVDDAWKHRLYPFDGPTIEEVTAIFSDIDLEQLVYDKLDAMPDRILASNIKNYYGMSYCWLLKACVATSFVLLHHIVLAEHVITLDHAEYKNADRPPAGTPEDIRPFLLSKAQLKSFNSDFLRSALRKTKVNKFFCILLRGNRIIGVPKELTNLGNEAFARSIRTHQIIAFFTRYHAVYTTKYPDKRLDLTQPEHKILLDCLKDIMRRVTAKKVIQQAVVGGLEHHHHHAQQQQQQQQHATAVAAHKEDDMSLETMTTMTTEASTAEGHTSDVDHDEKENSSFERSFDSSITSPGSHQSIFSPSSREVERYHDVLSLLSEEAKRSVEAMVDKIKRQIEMDAVAECARRFEEGRKVGRMEGRIIGYEEANKQVQE